MASWKTLTIVACAAIAVSLQPKPASAQNGDYYRTSHSESMHSRLRELESQLSAMQQQLDSGFSGGCDGACDGGCDGGCGACAVDVCGDCGCSDCAGGRGLYVGAAVVWIKPHFESDQFGRGKAANIQTFAGTTTNTVQVPYDTDYEVTPRFWVGWENCNGNGLRARFWQFDQEPYTFATNIGANQGSFPPGIVGPAAITSSHDTDLKALDLELTKRFGACGWTVVGSGGLRYGKLDHVSRSVGAGGVVTPGTVATQVFAESFEGLGPTFALEVSRKLWRGIGFYSSLRESVLFGDDDFFSTNPLTTLQGAPIVTTTVGTNDEALFISELEIGLEWRGDYSFGQIRARLGYEGQLWHAAGGPFNDELDLGLEGGNFSLSLHR